MARYISGLLLCMLFCLPVIAENIPREHVFVFERSTNTNYVCYDINLTDDGLNLEEPLKIYWVLGGETRTEGLTFLDSRMAFGVKVIGKKKDEATIHLVAYKKLPLRICKLKGKWVAIVHKNGRDIIVEKFYARMKTGIYMRCEYVDIYGTDAATGQEVKDRITP